jgi:type I restriction enzyme S subunit
MKSGWVTKCIDEIAEVKGGKRVPKGYKLLSEATAHPYLTVSDFTDDGTIKTENIQYISDDVFKEIKRYTISSKDVYISIAGTIGKTGVVPPELDGANLTENACKLVLKSAVDRDFLLYFTKSQDFYEQAAVNTRVAAQPKLALERLKTIKLSFPVSIPEQQRIVGILEKAFASIAAAKASAEKNLLNIQRLSESFRSALFSRFWNAWKIEKVCDIGQVFDGPHATPKTVASGPIFLGISSLRRGEIDLRESRHVTEIDFERWTRRVRPQEGDVVFSYETRLGEVALIPSGLECCLGRRMGLVRVNRQMISPEFFVLQYRSPQFQDHLRTKTIHGATVDRISIKEFPGFPIRVPKLAEQNEIVDRAKELQLRALALESTYRRKLAALDELKNSLLHQAFTGQL